MNSLIGLTSSALLSVGVIASGQPASIKLAALTAPAMVMVAKQKKQVEDLVKTAVADATARERQVYQVKLNEILADNRQAIQADLERIEQEVRAIEELTAKTATNDRKVNQAALEKIKQELKEIEELTTKVDKKVKTVHTSNRLLVSSNQKGQRQLKILTLQQQKLELLLSPTTNLQPVKVEEKPHFLLLPTKEKSVTYVYIDGNNLKKTAQGLELEIDWKALKSELFELGQGTAAQLKYYTGVHNRPSPRQKQHLSHLQDLNYQTTLCPIANRGNGKCKTIGDDLAICMDAMEDVKTGDRVILVSGDGDFTGLVKKLIARGAKVTVIGGSDSTNYSIKNLLKQDFISLESIAHKIVVKSMELQAA